MKRNEYERVAEVAKRFNKPSWIKRYAGGDESEAIRQLAEKYGFRGREGYLRSLCSLFAKHPNREEYESELAQQLDDAKQSLVNSLAHLEVPVEDFFRKGTHPEEVYFGDCYRRALDYVQDSESDACLVHGKIMSEDKNSEIGHAWAELPSGIVFDGVTQRFYDREGYYTFRGAIKVSEYNRFEALCLFLRQRNYGPWTDD